MKQRSFKLKYTRIERWKKVKIFFLMNLAFFTKILADVRNQAQVLLKLSCTLGKLVNTQTKGITLLRIGKSNVCIWFWRENVEVLSYIMDIIL